MELSDSDREMLDGGRGEATSLPMRIVLELAEIVGAERTVRAGATTAVVAPPPGTN